MLNNAIKTIFLAEGENHVRAALRLQIELQDAYQVSGEAEHTECLLAQVCQKPPDVILLDWHLPGINPQRLIHTLREHCPTTILIVISVKTEDKKSSASYGIDGFLSKQQSPASFITALRDITAKSNRKRTR